MRSGDFIPAYRQQVARSDWLGERVRIATKHVVPTVLGGHRLAVALGAVAVAGELPMLELDPGRGVLTHEPDLDLARERRIGHWLAAGTDLPGEGEPPGRLPGEHPSPVAAEAMRAALEARASLARLDRDRLEHCLAPGVRGRVPIGEPSGEALECVLRGHWHGDRCANGVVGKLLGHRPDTVTRACPEILPADA